MRSYSASQVAACIGENKYEPPCDVIEKLWKKENRQSYFVALKRCKPTNSYQQQQNDLFTALRSSAGQQVQAIQRDTTLDVSEKVEQIKKQKTDLSDAQETALKKYSRSSVCTKHGTLNEKTALELYATQTNTSVKLHTKLEHIMLNDSVKLTGKVDGLDMQNNKIIEIKNRTRRLFEQVVPYEYCQVQCYMQIFDMPCVDLVEYYKGDINIFPIEKNTQYITWMNKSLYAFDNLLSSLVNDFDAQNLYFAHEDRSAYVLDCIKDSAKDA